MKKSKKNVLSPEEVEKFKTRLKKLAISFSIKIVLTTAILLVALNFFIGFYRVSSNDMYPVLRDGDLITYLKFVPDGYFAKDIVVYEHDGNLHVGRIFAVQNDQVGLTSDGWLSLNNSGVYESIHYITLPKSPEIKYPLTVPENQVFILGDYRTASEDSRTFGTIPVSNIKGRVNVLLLRYRGFD